MRSEIFKALLSKRNRVQLDKRTKNKNRNSKLARKEKNKQLNGE